jgi:hypothetical protein
MKCTSEPVVASADAGVMDSGRGDIRTDEQVTGVRSASSQDLPAQVDTVCWILCWCQDVLGPSTAMLSTVC